MSDVIGQILPFAVGVAISPVPIIAVVLMLATARGRVNGPAFLAGWTVGLLLAGTVILLVAGGADASAQGEPSSWVGWLKLMLGLALLALVPGPQREPRGRRDRRAVAGSPRAGGAISGSRVAPRSGPRGGSSRGFCPGNSLCHVFASDARTRSGVVAIRPAERSAALDGRHLAPRTVCDYRVVSRRDLVHVLTALSRLSSGNPGVGVPVAQIDEAIGRGHGDMRTPLNLQSLSDEGLVARLPEGTWTLTTHGLAWLKQDRELSDR